MSAGGSAIFEAQRSRLLSIGYRMLGSRTDAELELADDLSIAFLLLLERLAPDERAAFLLHDVFEVGYPEIAATIDKREDAVRQIVSRARKRIAEERPRFRASKAAQQRLAQQFLRAVQLRDSAQLAALFRPDAVLISDGGGKVVAARRPILGASRIAKFFLGITRDIAPGEMRFELGWMNDAASVFVYDRSGAVILALGFDVQGDVIDGLYAVRNPDKLGGCNSRHEQR
jgi:RNA polymerase sigma-70 factor (ECF subfamily)